MSALIRIRAFVAEDAARIVVQRGQAAEGAIDVGMAGDGPAFTIEAAGEHGASEHEAGRLLMIGGLVEVHRGHAIAWASLAEAKGAAFLAVTRATRAVIAGSGYRRVSMLARDGFAPAHRWARLIGLTREGMMRSYGEDGSDYAVYARVSG